MEDCIKQLEQLHYFKILKPCEKETFFGDLLEEILENITNENRYLNRCESERDGSRKTIWQLRLERKIGISKEQLLVYEKQQEIVKAFQESVTNTPRTTIPVARNSFEGISLSQTPTEAYLRLEAELCFRLKALQFFSPVAFEYNPLEYASIPHTEYVQKYCERTRVLFLGMNPSPYGMGQNGVPFGDSKFVRKYLEIESIAEEPYPRSPLFNVKYSGSEQSGEKLWGLFKSICGKPENFFKHCFVRNYCPLLFLDQDGRNLALAGGISADDRKSLQWFCDEALRKCIIALEVEVIVGVGDYAAKRATKVVKDMKKYENIKVVKILHPAARRISQKTWEDKVTNQLKKSEVYKIMTDFGSTIVSNVDSNELRKTL